MLTQRFHAQDLDKYRAALANGQEVIAQVGPIDVPLSKIGKVQAKAKGQSWSFPVSKIQRLIIKRPDTVALLGF
jgi:hypothetical protein